MMMQIMSLLSISLDSARFSFDPISDMPKQIKMITPSTSSKTRKAQAYKFITRKNSCEHILYLNVAFLILLLIGIHSSVNYAIFSWMVIKRDRNDQFLLNKYNGSLNYFACPYIPEANYSTVYCHEYCGTGGSFITRLHRLDKFSSQWFHKAVKNSESSPNCADRLELLDCHESLGDAACLNPRVNITECGGMFGSNLIKNLDEHSTHIAAVDAISDYMDRTVLANQLIIQCPTCQVVSRPFKIRTTSNKMTECYQKVTTATPGWPFRFKWCENVVKVPMNASLCPILDANPKQ